MNMISYYELLGMIKEDKAPNKIRVHLTSEPREYKMIFDCGECNYYELIGNENDDYKHYLSDSYLESMMFKKTIKILNEIKKIPYYSLEKINNAKNLSERREERLALLEKRVDDIHSKTNEIIDYLNSKGE